jgi:NAD(P)H dehydrogenase (quinone)
MITVTAAIGHYGRLVIEELLKRGVPADDLVAAVRTPHKAADLADRGVQVREADYDRPETLVPAFTGADKLLLIPSGVYGQRYPQMQRAVKAAAEAGVGLLAYPGFINSDTSTLRLGEEHKQTEALLRASGLPFVLLRNGAYTEMYTDTLGPALQYGAILGSAGDGKVSAATRADLAEAAAVVLTSDGTRARSTSWREPRSPWPSWPPRCPSRPASTSSTRTCRSRCTPRRWPPRACPRRWPTSWPTPASP